MVRVHYMAKAVKTGRFVEQLWNFSKFMYVSYRAPSEIRYKEFPCISETGPSGFWSFREDSLISPVSQEGDPISPMTQEWGPIHLLCRRAEFLSLLCLMRESLSLLWLRNESLFLFYSICVTGTSPYLACVSRASPYLSCDSGVSPYFSFMIQRRVHVDDLVTRGTSS